MLVLFVIASIIFNSDTTHNATQDEYITNSIGMKLRLIKAGSFIMGHDDGGPIDQSKPAHEVTLTYDYYIGVYEVTQAQYEVVMGENPAHFKGPNLPVESIPFDKAKEFCDNLSKQEGRTYRLPYEAEWEYALRAGTSTLFFWGDDIDLADNYGWHNGNSENRTHRIGEKKPNSWGLFDMCGNVEEYIQGNYGLYKSEPEIDPKGPPKPWGLLNCPLRGCSYFHDKVLFRSCFRHGILKTPEDNSPETGFRIICEINQH